MEFAITFKPDMTPQRIVSLTKQAEAAGFAYGWMFDSHVLWQEPFPLMTLMAANTERMRIGPCVTNPAVRAWSVAASLFATRNGAVMLYDGKTTVTRPGQVLLGAAAR